MLSTLVMLAIYLLILAVVLSIIWLVLSKIPGFAPFMWIVQVAFALVVLLVLLEVLLGGGGLGGLHFGRFC